MLIEEKPESPLREEITLLGKMLGDTIREIAGSDSLQVVEEMRHMAWAGRSGQSQSQARLAMIEFVSSLSNDRLRVVVRAFSILLDLMNLAEDRQRVRVLREREKKAGTRPEGESIREAVLSLKEAGQSANEMQLLLDQLHLELVFTAHPTEAKRRTVRAKLRKLRKLLNARDTQQLPAEKKRTHQLMQTELAKLWQTDVIRPQRPTVMQEVARGLSIKQVLWDVLPQIMRELRGSLVEAFPKSALRPRPCVTFGSWIGGDRDGHPHVTPEVTEQTLGWLRQAALDLHLAACEELFNSFTLSQRQMGLGYTLPQALSAAYESWPELKEELAGIPPDEVCRYWIGVIRWRLRQTRQLELRGNLVEGAYASSLDLERDVTTLLDSIAKSSGGKFLTGELSTWLDRIHVFGFHLARLDVRQDARQYREVLNEIFQKLDLCADPKTLDEAGRQQLLVGRLRQENFRAEKDLAEGLSEEAQETLDLFRLLHRATKQFGPQAIGGHVISMTSAPSDVLTVLWLWKQTAPETDQEESHARLPIIPLFETIEDLEQGPAILTELLDIPEYRETLRQQEDHQIVMIGYSDSTKDGGYLSACWSLYKVQQQLHRVASERGIQLTFFHGRGGSLGRGGGPAARSILSLPEGTFRGSLRLTEQGEVLADRYDDPAIAHRHLEQMVWASLLAGGQPTVPDKKEWGDIMDRLAASSYKKYRELVEQPDFVEFFRRATPIAEVEQLPIGSRPARRRGSNGLADLRAIPWVFSWTQCRCLIPAWYGFGAAVEELLQDEPSRQLLLSMYREWPFFRATVDNAELALAKTDLGIAEQYAKLANDSEALAQIESLISGEFRQAHDAILTITQSEELLDGIPWLKESIRLRNRYIDPLNLIQVELLRRSRNSTDRSEAQVEDLRHLTRLTINGLAAGMRTSG